MSYLEDTIDWQTVHYVDEWLDADVAQDYKDQPLAQDWARIGKAIEELGETIGALIGYTGQNPRKGITHTEDEMLAEVADTVMTGILAMYHFKKNDSEVRQILRAAQDKLYRRMIAAKAPTQEGIVGVVNKGKIG